MELQLVGFNWIHTENLIIDRPNGLPWFCLVLFRSNAKIIIGGKTIKIDSPHLILYDIGQRQYYEQIDGDFINDWILFYGNSEKSTDAYDFLKKLNIPFNTLIPCHDSTNISSMIQQLENEYTKLKNQRIDVYNPNTLTLKSFDYIENSLFDSYLRLILCKVASEYSRTIFEWDNKAEQYKNQLIAMRNKLIEEHAPNVKISQLAESVNLSPSYFQKLYKTFFKISVGYDLILIRIDYACSLLMFTTLSIGEIAEKCHYLNTEHFIRQFKDFKFSTPYQYRKNYLIHSSKS